MKKERADKILVSRGLVKSRHKAQALIMAGAVCTEKKKRGKTGEKVEKEGGKGEGRGGKGGRIGGPPNNKKKKKRREEER